MSDPVSVSISLQNMKSIIQACQGYQQATSDTTLSAFVATLKTTLAANEVAGSPPAGVTSALGQSAYGGVT
jgi:hypothetical protein